MILKEDPDLASFEGEPFWYYHPKAITFGVVGDPAPRFMKRGQLLSATQKDFKPYLDVLLPFNLGKVTHAKLPFIANEEWAKEALDVAVRATKAFNNMTTTLGLGTSDLSIPKIHSHLQKILNYKEIGIPRKRAKLSLNILVANGLHLPEELNDAISFLNTPEVRKFMEEAIDLDSFSDTFADRYGIFSIFGRMWPAKYEGRPFVLASFWGAPSSVDMGRVATELVRKYRLQGQILVQNDTNDINEWMPVGVSSRILGDDVLKEIKELSSRLHTATPEEKVKIRNRISSLKAQAGIEDESPKFGAAKKANVASKAGFRSTAEYSAAATQESFRKSLELIRGNLFISDELTE
jgi:hypothetical protein